MYYVYIVYVENEEATYKRSSNRTPKYTKKIQRWKDGVAGLGGGDVVWHQSTFRHRSKKVTSSKIFPAPSSSIPAAVCRCKLTHINIENC